MAVKQKKRLRILFIGNSHTYYNDMPNMVARRFRDDGYDCEVTMLAHGGWFLDQHVQEPDVRYNILYGNYDYVVLQEHAHPFGPIDRFYDAVRKLNEWIRQANAVPVIYMTWARENEEHLQEMMTSAHEKIAEEIDALIAPVGKYWWTYKRSWPDITMYAEDGAHASASGSDFAAKYIWDAITNDIHSKKLSVTKNR